MTRPITESGALTPAARDVLADLARAKATFQQMAILAHLGVPARATPTEDHSNG